MKRCLYMILTALLAFQWFSLHPVQAEGALSVSAEHAVLMDAASGRVLYEKDAYEPALIASTTKIMTALIAVESGKMDEKVTVSKRAVYTEGSSIYLTEKESIRLKDLVYGLMLRSGNDAAVAIAEHVGGSVEGFVQMMNDKAAWLGMNDSRFENPHGLDGESHLSSAYDLGLLMAYAMKDEMFREITGSESYLSENRDYAWMNKNKMLTQYYDPTNGGKTGFTKAAGRTLVTSAAKEGMELIAVTLNAPDDWNDHRNMFEWGFAHFETVLLQKKGTVKVGGEAYYVPRDLAYPLTSSEKEQLEAVFYPVEEGTGLMAGVTYYKSGNNPIVEAAVWKERPPQSFLREVGDFLHRMMGVAPWST
ncbi:D-alanyl-D-alanine carboxypeptidase family protein [Halobacillus kuroshimensis]